LSIASPVQPVLNARLVLFDLDGTLVDTAPDIAHAVNLMLVDLARPAQPVDKVVGWIGNGMLRLVKRGLTGERDGEPDPLLFERGLASFKMHYAANLAARSRPFPGVVAALDVLRERGFALGCVTNKIEMFTRPLLDQLGLSGYFGAVVAGDTLAVRKPDPRPLLHACAQCGVAPERAVMVGDSATDINAARAAGTPVIAVTYGYNQGLDVRALKPDVAVDSAAEVPQYLRLYSTE
jgi:phosphoglycolate phosphatase